jgi:hypothetical protein
MTPDHPTPPSGESAPPSLEERDREAVRRMAARIVSEGQPWRFAVPGNVELLAAEVARLTAEREDHGPDGRNVTNAQHQAMRERALAAEARAARAEEALEEQQEAQRLVAEEMMPRLREMIAGGYVSLAVSMIDDFTTKVWRGVEMIDQLLARRALTEGADHVEQ